MNEPVPPTDEQIRLMIAQTLEQVYSHADASTKLLSDVHSHLLAVQAGSNAVAKVVDDNETEQLIQRDIEARKEIISHLYDKAHQYTTIIIAGAFAAFFTTLAVVSERLSDAELMIAAALMTFSLTVFVVWEVVSMAYQSFHIMKGDFGTVSQNPTWLRVGWPVAILLSLGSALPAAGLMMHVYLRTLGLYDWIGTLF